MRDIAKEVVDEANQKKVNKLQATIDHISTQNILLKTEDQGFKEALFAEKKKRKRAKKLIEEVRALDDNNAMWWSPTKIQALRELTDTREKDKEVEQANKQFQKEQQQQQAKIAKQQDALQKRQQRQKQQEEKKAATQAEKL